MAHNDILSKSNKIELYSYEFLGVRVFRKAILSFEKIKHLQDGKRNENYHPKNSSLSAMESFSGYLIYNSLFHIVAILLVIVYSIIAVSLQFRYTLIDIVMCTTVAFNLYCIMLQRYIYLKIKIYIAKAKIRRSNKIKECLKTTRFIFGDKDDKDLKEEFALLKKIQICLCNGEDCFLAKDCAEVLSRLAVLAENVKTNDYNREKMWKEKSPLNQMLSMLGGQTLLNSRIEKQVSCIQKLLRVEETRNIAFGLCIITEDSNCEAAFRKVFPDTTRDEFEFVLIFLLDLYKQRGLVVK